MSGVQIPPPRPSAGAPAPIRIGPLPIRAPPVDCGRGAEAAGRGAHAGVLPSTLRPVGLLATRRGPRVVGRARPAPPRGRRPPVPGAPRAAGAPLLLRAPQERPPVPPRAPPARRGD